MALQQLEISGMSCQNCVRKISEKLQTIPGISNLQVQLESPQASFESRDNIDLTEISNILPGYQVEEIHSESSTAVNATEEKGWLATYKPLLLIVGFIIGTTLLAQFPFEDFSWMLWMRHFMAGFFIVFSFFKFLNLSGFANSYAMYDIVAARWKSWGYIYPFVELGLGVLYLTNLFPFYTNLATAIILGISSIGVIQSNLNKNKIQCACLGDVFDLPMSTVTIVEDLLMVSMALMMLWLN